MNRIELLDSLRKFAIDYRLGCEKSINCNKHMNELDGTCEVDQLLVDAILTDYINFIAVGYCVDYGMYTTDLEVK